MIRSWSNLKASFLCSSFHDSRKCWLRLEAVTQLYSHEKPVQLAESQDMHVSVNGTHMLVRINSCLIRYKALITGGKPFQVLETAKNFQGLVIIDLRKYFTTTPLLSIILYYILTFNFVSAATFTKKASFQLSENHNWRQCRDLQIVRIPAATDKSTL